MVKYRTPKDDMLRMHRLAVNADYSKGLMSKCLESLFGSYGLVRSILYPGWEQECKFRAMLELMKPKVLIDIGTANGISSFLETLYADKVITIDIDRFPMAEVAWHVLGVIDKIDSYIVDDDEDKANLLNSVDFDCAFIDGDHSTEGVTADFNAVKKCGTVLFHDYWENNDKAVRDFVDSLPKEEMLFDEPFALWRAA